MGFYIELQRTTPTEYSEKEVPGAFFSLYAIAGFALICMGVSAYALLGDLFREGSWFDRAIVLILGLSIPAYLAAGIKIFSIRKFVRFSGKSVSWGYQSFGRSWRVRSVTRDQVQAIELTNRRPSPNIAPRQHDDGQYYIRGHWQLILRTRDGKTHVIDKHTEKEAVSALETDLRVWMQGV